MEAALLPHSGGEAPLCCARQFTVPGTGKWGEHPGWLPVKGGAYWRFRCWTVWYWRNLKPLVEGDCNLSWRLEWGLCGDCKWYVWVNNWALCLLECQVLSTIYRGWFLVTHYLVFCENIFLTRCFALWMEFQWVCPVNLKVGLLLSFCYKSSTSAEYRAKTGDWAFKITKCEAWVKGVQKRQMGEILNLF